MSGGRAVAGRAGDGDGAALFDVAVLDHLVALLSRAAVGDVAEVGDHHQQDEDGGREADDQVDGGVVQVHRWRRSTFDVRSALAKLCLFTRN